MNGHDAEPDIFYKQGLMALPRFTLLQCDKPFLKKMMSEG